MTAFKILKIDGGYKAGINLRLIVVGTGRSVGDTINSMPKPLSPRKTSLSPVFAYPYGTKPDEHIQERQG